MKTYTLVASQPPLQFELGFLQEISNALPIRMLLGQYLHCLNSVTLREDDYEKDIADLMDGSEESRASFVSRHCQTMHINNNATLGIGRPNRDELFIAIRSVHDEYRNWKFNFALDESTPVDYPYLDSFREIALLYSSIENVDMTRDIFYAYYLEKLADLIYGMLREAFNSHLEMFGNLYDGIIRGARFSLNQMDSCTPCVLELTMEKDESV